MSRRFEKPLSPMQRAREDGAVVERKPRGAKHGGKAFGKSGAKTGGKSSGKPNAAYEAKRGGASDKPKSGKNLAPAVGKPNSKKIKRAVQQKMQDGNHHAVLGLEEIVWRVHIAPHELEVLLCAMPNIFHFGALYQNNISLSQ